MIWEALVRRPTPTRVFDDRKLIATFERWIGRFKKDKINANPQRNFMLEVSQPNDYVENSEPVKEKKQKKDNC